MDKVRYTSLLASFLLLPLAATAQEVTPSKKTFYITANAGLFQGTFNARYTDKSDVIQQNIAETIQQKGYTGGAGIGYSKILCQNYLLGFEFSAGGMNQNATYQSGSATSAFTDKLSMENYFDLVFVPGVFLTPSLASYLKLGVTWGNFSNVLNTPTGYDPITVNSKNSEYTSGFTASIGLKKWLLPALNVFAEYNYRDYGSIRFPSFQNFQTAYSHSARAFGQSVLVGLSYQFA